MKALQILKAARELISDQTRWTVGQLARSATGRVVKPVSKKAVCWCAQGAVERVAGSPSSESLAAYRALGRATRRLHPKFCEPFEVNDALGHEATLQMFDIAIADAEGRS